MHSIHANTWRFCSCDNSIHLIQLLLESFEPLYLLIFPWNITAFVSALLPRSFGLVTIVFIFVFVFVFILVALGFITIVVFIFVFVFILVALVFITIVFVLVPVSY